MQDTVHREGYEHYKDQEGFEKGKDPNCKERRGSKCVML